MSCIAVCEVIDDESVKCKVHGEKHSVFINTCSCIVSVTCCHAEVYLFCQSVNLLRVQSTLMMSTQLKADLLNKCVF